MINAREELFPIDSTETQLDTNESSGVEAEYDGEQRTITGVIHILETSGEEIRAKLMRSLREVVKEAKATRVLARKLAVKEGVTPE
jgi:Fic family protein